MRLLKMVATFHLVALSWIFFRADSFGQAFRYLAGLCGSGGARTVAFTADDLTQGAIAVFLLLTLIDIPQYLRRDPCAALRWPLARRVAVFAILAVALILVRGTENVPFIYFKF